MTYWLRIQYCIHTCVSYPGLEKAFRLKIRIHTGISVNQIYKFWYCTELQYRYCMNCCPVQYWETQYNYRNLGGLNHGVVQVQYRYRHIYREYRYSWSSHCTCILPQHSQPSCPSPHCRHQLPKHSICPARRHHYGTNMVTIIILPLSPTSPPSIYYLTR